MSKYINLNKIDVRNWHHEVKPIWFEMISEKFYNEILKHENIGDANLFFKKGLFCRYFPVSFAKCLKQVVYVTCMCDYLYRIIDFDIVWTYWTP